MFKWFYQLDRILRGEATRPDALEEGEIKIPLFGIGFVLLILAVVYGFCMGTFALVRGFENKALQQAYMQTIASMCKVPLLFLLTLLITFPSLYVFNALVGSQLRIMSVLKLLVASLGVNITLLASLGPIVVFFTLSTPDYAFIVGLNVVVYAVAGLFGMAFLLQSLNRLTVYWRSTNQPPSSPVPEPGESTESPDPSESSEGPMPPVVISDQPVPASLARDSGPLEPTGKPIGSNVRAIFVVWMFVFGLVGSQMGWVLRPFIGTPGKPFEWFRPRESNFFETIGQLIENVLR